MKEYVFAFCFFQTLCGCEQSYFLSKQGIITLEEQYRHGILLADLVQRAERLADAAQHRAIAFLCTLFSETAAHKDPEKRIQDAFFVARMYSDERIHKLLHDVPPPSINDLERLHPVSVKK